MSCKPVCDADPSPVPSILVDYASHALPNLLEPEPLRHSQTPLMNRMAELPLFRSISSAPGGDLIPPPWILDTAQAHHYDRRWGSSDLSQKQPFPLSRPWVTLQAPQVIPNMSLLGDPAAEQRARLEHEADQIREMLQSTERELAALRR